MVLALQRHEVCPGARIIDLCCGAGLQASGLARAGYRVVGVDLRRDAPLPVGWSARIARQANLHFVSGDARRLPLRGRFAAATLLTNGLSLFADNDDALAVMRQVRRLVGRTGLFLLDNSVLRLWREIAAGRYASGLSEDGTWQMAWLAGRNVFSLRYGNQVRPDHPAPRPGEPLYRAWSLDELDLLCRLSGWHLERQTARTAVLVLRAQAQRCGART